MQRINGRMLAIAVLFFVILAGLVALIFSLTSGGEKKDSGETVAIADQDKKDISEVANKFFQRAGNFGYIPSALTDDSAANVFFVVETKAENANDFFVSRADSYNSMKDIISSYGGVAYPSATVSGWGTDFETNARSSFVLDNATLGDIPLEAKTNTVKDGSDIAVVTVPVSVKSHELTRYQTVTDETWDGTFQVMRQNYDNNFTLSLSRDPDGRWRVFSVSGLEQPFVLSTWKSPDVNAFSDRDVSPSVDGKITVAVPDLSEGN